MTSLGRSRSAQAFRRSSDVASSPSVLQVVIGLGGNIKPRLERLRVAVREIVRTPGFRLLRASPIYESEPWGVTDQPRFLNAAILVETNMTPIGTMDALLDIERRLGRDRSTDARHWGPRTVDLDILLVPGRAISEPRLMAPHPRLRERDFALRPLLDLLPDATDPADGARYDEHLRRLGETGLRRFAGSELLENP
jgi:2-amino-4-hydroxy-6-hydroxymethyldihydropteridine diphosphokinase